MKLEFISSPQAHDRKTGYSQAVHISGHSRTVLVSGQIPVHPDGSVPEDFSSQAELVWANVKSQLEAAQMGLENIAKVTIFLSDRKYRAENTKVRQEVLGAHEPALTVIITGIFDEAWLLEIEVEAVA